MIHLTYANAVPHEKTELPLFNPLKYRLRDSIRVKFVKQFCFEGQSFFFFHVISRMQRSSKLHMTCFFVQVNIPINDRVQRNTSCLSF